MAIALPGAGTVRGMSRWWVVRAWLAGLVIYSLMLRFTDDRFSLLINDVSWTLASGVAAVTCLRIAGTLAAGSRRGWRLIGAACASWCIGQLFWSYNELVLGIPMPVLTLTQVFYSSMPLLMIAGISQLPERPQEAPFMLKQLGNLGLVTCCLVITIVLGLIEPALQSTMARSLVWIGAIHNISVAATFLYALHVLWTYRWSSTWGPMLIIVSATGIYAVSNIIYARSLITATYLPGDLINMSWLVVFGLITWAASERGWLVYSPDTAASDRMLHRERWVEAVIPAFLIVIMVVVSVASAGSTTPRTLSWATVLFIAFAVILGVREALIQSDAQRLNDELLQSNRRLNDTVAELRNSEQRYRDLNTELERRVAERTAQLERAYGELEGFSYAVAHDLKAPLRAISGFSHLLREDLGAGISQQSDAHLGRIRAGAMKMSALIDDLLSYAHIERRDLHVSQVSLRQLVAAVLTEFDDEIQPRGVNVIVEIEDATVLLDAEGLTLALRNLIENALKYSRAVESPAITVRVTRGVEGIMVAIADNGIGFDMEYHDRIFKVFQRLHRDDQYPGTGIGLALVNKAIERIGGRVWAQSEPGAGATFFIELPNSVVLQPQGEDF